MPRMAGTAGLEPAASAVIGFLGQKFGVLARIWHIESTKSSQDCTFRVSRCQSTPYRLSCCRLIAIDQFLDR